MHRPLPGTCRPDTARESTTTVSGGSVPKGQLSRPLAGCQAESLPPWLKFEDQRTGCFPGRRAVSQPADNAESKDCPSLCYGPLGHHGQAIQGHFLGGSHTWHPECWCLQKGISCMCPVPWLLSGGHQEDRAHLPRSLKRITVDH